MVVLFRAVQPQPPPFLEHFVTPPKKASYQSATVLRPPTPSPRRPTIYLLSMDLLLLEISHTQNPQEVLECECTCSHRGEARLAAQGVVGGQGTRLGKEVGAMFLPRTRSGSAFSSSRLAEKKWNSLGRCEESAQVHHRKAGGPEAKKFWNAWGTMG